MAGSTSSKWDARQLMFLVFAGATIVGIAASMLVVENRIPPRIYVFGFLGSMVYVFTSLARKFDRDDRYMLEVASKAMAAFPLAAGIYLLAFAFPGGEGGIPTGDRLTNGLAFLAGAYVSLTLNALGGLAERLLGVTREDVVPADVDTETAGETDVGGRS